MLHYPLPDYDQASLDAQYTNTGTPQADADLASLRGRSASARASLPFETGMPYGRHPLETFELVRAPGEGASPALVFVHGGQWQFNTTAETSFLGGAAHARGLAYVGINYPKVPDVRLGDQAASVTHAWRTLTQRASNLGLDPRGLVLVGHSSGAHLAALALMELAGATFPPACAVLFSGMYDLEPVRRTSRNVALGLDEAEARAASPVHRVHQGVPPVLAIAGTDESQEFQRQAHLLNAALGGAAPHRVALLPGERHFTTPLDLFDHKNASWQFIDTILTNPRHPGRQPAQ